MYKDELLSSYKPGAYEAIVKKFTVFEAAEDDGLVTLGPIEFSTICAHHCMPFVGTAYIGYVPGEKLVGASKFPRIVDYFSNMLQIQERLGRQIADFVQEHAQSQVVIVLLRAGHMCIRCRGVRKNSLMATTTVRPREAVHENRGLLDEFYQHVQLLEKGDK